MKKGLITAFACALMVLTMPFSVKADHGEPIRGGERQQDAAALDNAEQYRESRVEEGRNYFYKFNTGAQDGIHLISLESVVASNSSNGTLSVQVMDTYGTVVDGASVGGPNAKYTNYVGGRVLDVLLPVSGLAKNTWYYICINTNDGDPAREYEITNRISEKFVSFLPAADFKMNYGSGSLDFTWNNVQNANKYDPLKSFDGFHIELFANNVTRTKYAGNGGATSMSISTNDPDLVALGYPTNSVRIRLGCSQTFHSVFENNVAVTKWVYSTNVINTEVTRKKTQSAVSGLQYKVTSVKNDGTGTVTVLGFSDKNAKVKKLKIGQAIVYKGISYKITSISPKAFAGNKSITSVELGENITKVGDNAFEGCTGIKKVTIKSKRLKKVGKRAFVNVNNNVKVTCPTKALKKKYKKLFKNKINASAKYAN